MADHDANDCLAIEIPDAHAMDRLGSMIARALRRGDFVAVAGPLGAGKSQLCRAIVRTLLNDPFAEVPSPSYTLVNVYPNGETPIWHADLYRISDPDELAELGLDDTADAIVLLEWPQRWPTLPKRRLDIEISPRPDQSRSVSISARGRGWTQLLSTLEAA